jgi:MYXO-CTERM domain-containing protein
MHRRFVLSVAGVAGAAMSAPSLADDITITMHLDYWAGEHGMSFSNASGGVISSVINSYVIASASGAASVIGSSLASWTSGVDPYTSGYRWTINASVESGDYDVLLTDSYGDGWAWNEVTGADAFEVTGGPGIDVSGDTMISFSNGSSRNGTVTVSPAPGAVALLGLAGIAGRRRQRG